MFKIIFKNHLGTETVVMVSENVSKLFKWIKDNGKNQHFVRRIA